MSHEQRIGIALLGALLPGFAHAVVGQPRAALLWAAAGLVPCVAVLYFGLPALAAVAGVRLIAGVASWWAVREGRGKHAWTATLPTAIALVGIAGVGFLKWSVEMYKVPSSSMNPTIEVNQHLLVDELTLRWHAPERGEVVTFPYPCDPARTHIKRVAAIAGDTIELRCSVLYVNGQAVKSELVKAHDSYKDYDADGKALTREVSRYREHVGNASYDIFDDVERPERGGADDRDFPQRGKPFLPGCQQGEFYEHAVKPVGTIVEVSRATPAKPCEQQIHYRVPDGYIFVLGDNRSNSNDSRVFGAVRTSAVTGRMIMAF